MQSRGSMTDSMTAEAFYSRTLTVYGGFKNNPSHRVSLFIPFFILCVLILTAFWDSFSMMESHQRQLITIPPSDFIGLQTPSAASASSSSLQGWMGSLSKYAKSLSHLEHDIKWLLFLYCRFRDGKYVLSVMPGSNWAVSSYRVQI